MNIERKTTEIYQGFEQGPIRPPSEANSLLIRVTRNCPWNRCTFCPVYKGSRFSVRPKDHVIKDIDSVFRSVEIIQQSSRGKGNVPLTEIRKAGGKLHHLDPMAYNAALNWVAGGMQSVFIQDANSLIIKSSDLVDILVHLKKRFPWIERITSYARSHTIARISDGNLRAIKDAGLNRIHIGLESGSNHVLKMTQKGVTKETHIKAGLKVKKAGMELSEYVMPGLGGKTYSKEHAVETADALNRINPDFIRLRTLALPDSVSLHADCESGRFEKSTDLMMVEETLLFIESLNAVTSEVKSDHVLNLFQNLEGKLPEDKESMLDILRRFLAMTPDRQCTYQVGRRLGFFSRMRDMENPRRLERAEKACKDFGITPENVEGMVEQLMKRFI
jgi:hypothetical protein